MGDNNKNYIVAIDGPSAAGKTTVAKLVAKELGIPYLDTGAMYRALALKILEKGVKLPGESINDIDDLFDEEHAAREMSLLALLESTEIEDRDGVIYMDGRDVSSEIRKPEVTKCASQSSALPQVRAKLVAIQRACGKKSNIVVDGRDIGSNVFPDAKYKFFLTASPEVRAQRRFLEMQERGETPAFEKVLEDLNSRDYADSNRSINPLIIAEGAEVIDTENQTAEMVVTHIVSKIN